MVCPLLVLIVFAFLIFQPSLNGDAEATETTKVQNASGVWGMRYFCSTFVV